MNKPSQLNKVVGKKRLSIPEPSSDWPLHDQYVGIELEIEGHNTAQVNSLANDGKYWTTHVDNSLRNGIELVLAAPLMGKQLSEAISSFFSTVTRFTASPRTSAHVHLNMLQEEDTTEVLRTLLILYFIYEPAFFAVAGEHRKWSTYCSSFDDTQPPVFQLIMSREDPKLWNTFLKEKHTTDRYYGLNLLALSRYGTLEFRHLPMVYNEQQLVDWIHLLMHTKLAARRMVDDGVVLDTIPMNSDALESVLRAYFAPADRFSAIIDSPTLLNRFATVISFGDAASNTWDNGTWLGHGVLAHNAALSKYVAENKGKGKPAAKKKSARVPPPQRDSGLLEALLSETQERTVTAVDIRRAQSAYDDLLSDRFSTFEEQEEARVNLATLQNTRSRQQQAAQLASVQARVAEQAERAERSLREWQNAVRGHRNIDATIPVADNTPTISVSMAGTGVDPWIMSDDSTVSFDPNSIFADEQQRDQV